jgi:hypothetical protein
MFLQGRRTAMIDVIAGNSHRDGVGDLTHTAYSRGRCGAGNGRRSAARLCRIFPRSMKPG